jgi:arylsulfatase A-like enzyme
MIRTEHYKLNVYIEHGEELYDLKSDPQELVNLADHPDHAEARERLKADLDRWIVAHKDPFYTLETTPLKPTEWRKIGKRRARKPSPDATKKPKPVR